MVLDSVAGFNAKALSIMRMQLVGSNMDAIGSVELILNAMLLLSATQVAKNDNHGALSMTRGIVLCAFV